MWGEIYILYTEHIRNLIKWFYIGLILFCVGMDIRKRKENKAQERKQRTEPLLVIFPASKTETQAQVNSRYTSYNK